MTKNLVVYFSATGVTANVAKNLAHVVNGDIYEIKPVVPYSDADLNWMDRESRSSVEMRDKSSRPQIVEDDVQVENYDVIYLGFPIWWYVAPTIVNTFLEKYDFSNKKIILFATSGGSGFGGTVSNLKNSVAPSAIIIEGKLLNNNPTTEELKKWVENI
ncbi:MAG: NAD(P)H-dependent oxidoreductase [Clostridia bacterium]|nr:NAD(P)H-dependent oxidoreductase [Clostridia bacterium]